MSDKTHTMGKLVVVRSGESFGLSEGNVKAPRVATIGTEQLLPEAVAKRLIDCWNACKGINPEGVPELLEAAKAALELLKIYESRIEGEWGDGRSLEEIERDGDLPAESLNLRTAIAKAEGR